MLTQLAVMLTSEGKKERKAWEDLHTKVSDVATSIADPTSTIEDLLSTPIREMGSLVLGYPEAEGLLWRISAVVDEKVRAESAHASTAISLLKSLILLLADQLNMIPLCNSKHLYMIDESSTFSKKNVDELFKYSLDLCAPNAPYTVISIVGAQSSGKLSYVSYFSRHIWLFSSNHNSLVCMYC
jgi:hypothetical protein